MEIGRDPHQPVRTFVWIESSNPDRFDEESENPLEEENMLWSE
jgi:hypothetical protein